jgi:hypothetical protein
MVSVTLSVPEETRKTMKEFSEINWSGFIRQCIMEKAKRMKTRSRMLEELQKEREFNEWAVKLVREGRKAKR